MKAQLNVPTGLDEITLRQYQEFIKAQELNNDELFLQQKTIEIFCNVPEAKVKSIAANSVVEITNKINLLFEDRPEFKRFFYLNKVEFGFIPDLDEMSFGEYIDVDTYLSDWKSIHLAINVLYRPIVRKNAGRYEIEPYDTQTQDRALDMPMNAVLSAIFFFIQFKEGLVDDYPELFNRGGGDTTSATAAFGQKWGWYNSLYGLSQGNVERIDHVTKMKMHECLMMLAFTKEKNELESTLMKQKIK